MRKTLVTLLVLVMALGFAGTAFAAASQVAPVPFNDIAGNKNEASLTAMAALGIMSGYSGIGGPVRPDANITRAEFAKMIVGALGKASTATGLQAVKPTFKDQIASWAWGWVNTAYFMGLMRGDDKGNFRPADPVTYGEVVTVLVRSVRGHEAQLPGGLWPYNYVFYAVDNGFTGPVDLGFPSLPSTRGDVSAMLLASMQLDRVDKDGLRLTNTSALFARLFTGVVSDYGETSITIGGAVKNLADKVYTAGARDFEGLRSLSVMALADASGKVNYLRVIQTTNAFAGAFTALADSGGVKSLKFADGTRVPYTAPVTVTLNGAAALGAPPVALNETSLNAGDKCVVTLGADGKAVHVVATRVDIAETYITAVKKSTATTNTEVTVAGGQTFTVPAGARVAINGQTSGRDTLTANDIVNISTKALDGTTVMALTATRLLVEGTVKAERVVYVAGRHTHYATIEKANGSRSEYIVGDGLAPLGVGATGKFGLNADGAIALRVEYAAPTTHVLVKGYVTGSAGTSVILDMRGAEVTYATTFDFTTQVGKVGAITLDTVANRVTGFAPFADNGNTYAVVSVDATHGVVTLKTGATYAAVSDPVVYQYDTSDATYTYVALDKVGLWTSGATHSLKYDGSATLIYTVP